MRKCLVTRVKLFCAVAGIVVFLSACDSKVTTTDGAALVVMTYNVGNYQPPYPDVDAVTAVIKRAGVPDVLFCQDAVINVPMRKLAPRLELKYFIEGHQLATPVNASILSRYPLHRVRSRQLDEQAPGVGAVCADMAAPSGEVTVCSLYLKSISVEAREAVRRRGDRFYELSRLFAHEIFAATSHRASIDSFLQWLGSEHDLPVILGGDFNTIPVSRAIRDLVRHYDDALWMSGDYWTGTYTKLNFPIKPRIDYLFHSRDISVKDARVIQDTGGDHYPVAATLVISKQP